MNSRNRFSYPEDWHAVALELKAICGWQCMQCGTQCRKPGEAFDTWRRTLTVSHYYGDYSSPEIYAACLCLPCHFAHDAPHSWKARKRVYRLRQWMNGQLEMTFAPSPPTRLQLPLPFPTE